MMANPDMYGDLSYGDKDTFVSGLVCPPGLPDDVYYSDSPSTR